MATERTSPSGVVYLVGAGPGDPGLITLRGVECLRAADVVLYDFLANPSILQHAVASTELICCGKHGRGAMMTQEEICEQLVAFAQAGKQVVRLKGGDPILFARVAEELAALRAANIPYEIIPGVTAAQAAASYTGIPITHRDDASAVALVTGHERSDRTGSKLDFARLAQFPGTLVFYMGVTTARQWSQQLIDGGRSADTPVAIVRRATWADQQFVRCTLSTVAEEIEHRGLRPPMVAFVGQVVEHAPEVEWFAARPLFGQTVLVTRPEHQATSFAEKFDRLGARTLIQPAIDISEPKNWAAVDEAMARLSTYDWLVFSSANGVRYLLDRLLAEHGDLRLLASVKLAVIGDRTAEVLGEYHLHADLMPPEFRAESLAESLLPHSPGKRFLLARASRGREVLAEQLAEAGAAVDQIVVYQSLDVEQPEVSIHSEMEAGRVDWITVTSSAIARSLVKMFGESLRKSKLVSISPITTGTLAELGFDVAVEATEYTTDGMVEALLDEFSGG